MRITANTAASPLVEDRSSPVVRTFTLVVFDRLVECAKKENVEVQIEADPRPTGTDARAIQVARGWSAHRIGWDSPCVTCTPQAKWLT